MQYEEITKQRRHKLLWFLKQDVLSVKNILAQLKREESDSGKIQCDNKNNFLSLLFSAGSDTDTMTEKVLQKQRDFKKSLSNLSDQIDNMNETIQELKTTIEKLAPKKRKDHEPRRKL